jgi:uncharacterized membrane protein YkvA (DUF1232 family)
VNDTATPLVRRVRGARRASALSMLANPRALYRLLTDAEGPWSAKIVFLLAVAYVVFPVDAIPDVIPILGWLDDVGVVGAALAFLGRSAAEHEAARTARASQAAT